MTDDKTPDAAFDHAFDAHVRAVATALLGESLPGGYLFATATANLGIVIMLSTYASDAEILSVAEAAYHVALELDLDDTTLKSGGPMPTAKELANVMHQIGSILQRKNFKADRMTAVALCVISIVIIRQLGQLREWPTVREGWKSIIESNRADWTAFVQKGAQA